MKTKARRVWMICIKRRKFELARRISDKYDLMGRNHDRITAFGMALIARKIS